MGGIIRCSLLLASSLYLSISRAQSNNTSNSTEPCEGPFAFRDGYNATGSIATPGFRVNDSYPASTWTWSQYIVSTKLHSEDVTTDDVTIWQTIGLKTDPIQNLSDSGLLYTGCVIAPYGFKFSSKSEKDDGTCSSAIDADCLEEIHDSLRTNAASFSGSKTPENACSQLLDGTQHTNSKCKGVMDGWSASQFLSDGSTKYTNLTCKPQNQGDSDPTTGGGFFAWSKGDLTNPDNYTEYDAAIRFPQPIFVAVWLKNGSGIQYDASGAWSDSRVMCLPGNTTLAGSRNITEADAAANTAGRNGKSLLGVAVFAVLVGLFL